MPFARKYLIARTRTVYFAASVNSLITMNSSSKRLFVLLQLIHTVLSQNLGSATSLDASSSSSSSPSSSAADELFDQISRRAPTKPLPAHVGSPDDPPFAPAVSATCRNGQMIIKVETQYNFGGVVHARDHRKPACSGYGENSKVTFLRVNLLAEKGDPEYCGVFYTKPQSEERENERSLAIALRTHKTLELAADKFYMITCGVQGFQNSRNQTSLVNLKLQKNGKDVSNVVYGREYTLMADVTHPDGVHGLRVQRCFSFSDTNNSVALLDAAGCPIRRIMSDFRYDVVRGTAEATVYSMFKFPESHRVHIQCDILVCPEKCEPVDCRSGSSQSFKEGKSLGIATGDGETGVRGIPKADTLLIPPEKNAVVATTSVFVVEPGEEVDYEAVCSDCSGSGGPPYVTYLCVAFGVLFLVMLIINVLLCSAMTCTCAKASGAGGSGTHAGAHHRGGGGASGTADGDSTDKEPSIIEEFDPYTRSWHGSQYGSRYSLNDKIKPIPPPLISVETNHSLSSGNSESGLPAVYGVPARPSSRYSNRTSRSRNPVPNGNGGQVNNGYHHNSASSSAGSTTHFSKYAPNYRN